MMGNCMEKYLTKNILVVESDGDQRTRILRKVHMAAAEVNVCVHIYKAVDTVRAQKILNEKDIDMLIMNTDYGKNRTNPPPGIELAKIVRGMKKYMFLPLIFVSDRDDLREYAFTELNCMGYLNISFGKEDLKRVIEKGMQYTTERDADAEWFLKEKSVLYPVRIKDILYMEANDCDLLFRLMDHTTLKLSNRRLVVAKEKFANSCLLRCGRSVVINRDHVVRWNKKEVFLWDGEEEIKIRIGKAYRSEVKTLLG